MEIRLIWVSTTYWSYPLPNDVSVASLDCLRANVPWDADFRHMNVLHTLGPRPVAGGCSYSSLACTMLDGIWRTSTSVLTPFASSVSRSSSVLRPV